MGFGLGLFAIFGIIRYRTDLVPIREMTYLFIIIGFNYFVLGYNMSLSDSFLLGIIIYGIYETTNWAIFKNKSTKIPKNFITTITEDYGAIN